MAGRYATALFELALESKAVDQVQSDLKAFDALVASSPDLARLVRSPVFSADEQAKALAAVLGKAGIKGIAANFLRVVAGEPAPVRGARDHPRLQRAGRATQA
jgi:F-type H+-transporting ATPase subunit delta